MRLNRPLPWLLAALCLTVLIAGGAVYWLALRAQPAYQGERRLAGLKDAVTVDYRAHAIPSIRAGSLEDLLFAQGYVTAAERMWQMDLLRRAGRGLLAEAFGERALPVDRLMRTLGLGRAAERNLAALGPQARGLLQAYADGVNAYRKEAAGRPPLEYLLSGLEPAPWTPRDSLAIAEYMAYLLSFNAREELAFLRVVQRVGVTRARELFPTDEGIPAEPPPPGLEGLHARLPDPFAESDRLSAELGLPYPGPASNAWALDGSRTASGRPILANDPHLLASAPNIWFENELIGPGLHVTGVSLPGLPLVLIGHNGHLAWGMTTTMADTQDLVIERPTADGRSVQRADGREPIHERWEEIPVRGGAIERLRIRETGNGVILNEVLAEQRDLPLGFAQFGGEPLLALRWNITLPDSGFAGLLALNRATSIDEARAGIAQIAHAAQNVLLAHRDGQIAWQVSGRLPRRPYGAGSLPVPGWLAGYAWDGYHPPQDNPFWLAPADGQLVSANHRPVPLDHPVPVGRSWLAPYRAQRIAELLGERTGLTPADMAEIQADLLGLEVHHWQAALRGVAAELQEHHPAVWRDAGHLLGWDARFTPDSGPAALFLLLRRAFFHALLEDELGPALAAYMGVSLLAYNGIQETVRGGRSSFWDDVRTPQSERPADIWARALRRARADLDDQAGSRAGLGELRSLVFPHAFAGQPLLGRLFSVGPMPGGGDDYTVNVRKAAPSEPQRPLFIPSWRVVFTPGDWPASRASQPLGQSGHRFSPYRSDQLATWRAGGMRPLPWNGSGGAAAAMGRLRLLPAAGDGMTDDAR